MGVILGIDPGSIRTGWGVVEAKAQATQILGQGVLHLNERDDMAQRLWRLHTELKKIIEQYTPSEISIEKVFFGNNADSAFKLGQARGVVMALAGAFALRTGEYATRHVKKMLTGTGAASKDQVMLVVNQLLNVRVSEHDASDALALALCHAREIEIKNLMSEQSRLRGQIL